MTLHRDSALAACFALALAACGGHDHAAPPAFSNFQAAAVVIGQADFVSGVENGGQGIGNPSASGFHSISGLAITADGTLLVSEWSNNRIVGFPGGVPATNGAAASFVIGQGSFFENPRIVTNTSHPTATSVRFAAGKLVVTHNQNHRVVVFDTVPTGPGVQPDRLFGQSGFESSLTGCDSASFHEPGDAFLTPDGKLLVADYRNHRVLIWTTLDAPSPAVVLGQGTFNRCAANDDNQDGSSDGAPTARTFKGPAAIWSDGTRLVVSDLDNHRVLIWNRFPTTSFQPADIVLGQDTFAGAAFNDDNQDGVPDARPSARTFNEPLGIDVQEGRLALADNDNSRVLIWESFPTRNFQPADTVLGQGSFDLGADNDADQDGVPDTAPSDRTLSRPAVVLFHQGDLLVGDERNNRVLLFRRRPPQ